MTLRVDIHLSGNNIDWDHVKSRIKQASEKFLKEKLSCDCNLGGAHETWCDKWQAYTAD